MKKKVRIRLQPVDVLTANDKRRVEAVRAYMCKTEAAFFSKVKSDSGVFLPSPVGVLAGPLRYARPRKPL